jgi:hypothetical protein
MEMLMGRRLELRGLRAVYTSCDVLHFGHGGLAP